MAETETIVAPDAAAVAASAVTPTPTWRDGLPEELRADKSLESFKDVGALAKSYIATKAMVGSKAAIPGPDAKPDEIKAYHRAIGVPETPAEYKLKAHEMMAHPEWNREAQDSFVKLAHAAGMTPSQVDTAIQFYANFIGTQVKANQTIEGEAKAELRQEWGVNYDTYMGAANRGITRMEQMLKMEPGSLIEATKGSDPASIAKLFHVVESQFVEHGFVTGEPIGGVTADGARAKVQELQAQLMKVPEGSQQAIAIINEIAAYGRAMSRAA